MTDNINFISPLKEFEARLSLKTPVWLKDFRKAGIERFKSLGLPTTKDEEWKYTSVVPITLKKFAPIKIQSLGEPHKLKAYLNPEEINIVFINGALSMEFSDMKNLPQGMNVQNLAVALEAQADLKELFYRHDAKTETAFAALNNAYFNEGTRIHVDKNTTIEPLIHIVHVTTGKVDHTVVFPRSLIVLAPSAQASVLESHICFTELCYLTDAVTDIILNDNARLNYCKGQKESYPAFHVGLTRIWQERDSQCESFSLTTGASLTRNELWVTLNGPGAHCTLNGLYAITDKQHVDNHTVVNHKAPNCTSRELYKGILHDQARGVFNGKIFVQREAQLTNAYQLNKNLLLTKGCQVDTKPQLEIFADDVKCTHGATIGQLNEDELFYLRSRAISKSLAVKMLCRGFVDDILNEIPNTSIHGKLDKLLAQVLSTIA